MSKVHMKCYLGKKQPIIVTLQRGRVTVYVHSFRPVSWFGVWTIALWSKFRIKLDLSSIVHVGCVHAVRIVSAASFKAALVSVPERAQVCIGGGIMSALVVLLWQHRFCGAPGAVAEWLGWFWVWVLNVEVEKMILTNSVSCESVLIFAFTRCCLFCVYVCGLARQFCQV